MKNYLLPLLFVVSLISSTCGIFEPEERVEYIYADTLYVTDTLWVVDDGDDFETVHAVWVEWDTTLSASVVKFFCKAVQRTDEKYGTNVIAHGKLWTTDQDGINEYYSLTSGRFYADRYSQTTYASFKEKGTVGYALWSSDIIDWQLTYYWSIYLTY